MLFILQRTYTFLFNPYNHTQKDVLSSQLFRTGSWHCKRLEELGFIAGWQVACVRSWLRSGTSQSSRAVKCGNYLPKERKLKLWERVRFPKEEMVEKRCTKWNLGVYCVEEERWNQWGRRRRRRAEEPRDVRFCVSEGRAGVRRERSGGHSEGGTGHLRADTVASSLM